MALPISGTQNKINHYSINYYKLVFFLKKLLYRILENVLIRKRGSSHSQNHFRKGSLKLWPKGPSRKENFWVLDRTFDRMSEGD